MSKHRLLLIGATTATFLAVTGFSSLSRAGSPLGSNRATLESSSNYHPNLMSISFANAEDGWAAGGQRTNGGVVGPNGFIFRTTNAGKSWTRYTVRWDAQQMQFISPSVGWAIVSSPANCGTGRCSYAVVATSDGGKNWSLQLNGGRCWQIESLDFITFEEGWVIESGTCQ